MAERRPTKSLDDLIRWLTVEKGCSYRQEQAQLAPGKYVTACSISRMDAFGKTQSYQFVRDNTPEQVSPFFVEGVCKRLRIDDWDAWF
jgi:hypothetical protein